MRMNNNITNYDCDFLRCNTLTRIIPVNSAEILFSQWNVAALFTSMLRREIFRENYTAEQSTIFVNKSSRKPGL